MEPDPDHTSLPGWRIHPDLMVDQIGPRMVLLGRGEEWELNAYSDKERATTVTRVLAGKSRSVAHRLEPRNRSVSGAVMDQEWIYLANKARGLFRIDIEKSDVR